MDTVVIMAAGRGTRMGELTQALPKALIPVHGRPFLLYLLDHLAEAGYRRAIIVNGYKEECFTKIASEYPKGMDVELISQASRVGEERYGTAMAILAAEQDVAHAPFVVCSGDQLYAVHDLEAMRTKDDAMHLLGVTESSHPQDFGVVLMDADNMVQEILEKPAQPPSNLVNASLYRFLPAVFPVLHNVQRSARGEYELTDAVAALAAAHAVRAVLIEPMMHITDPDDIDAAHTFVRRV